MRCSGTGGAATIRPSRRSPPRRNGTRSPTRPGPRVVRVRCSADRFEAAEVQVGCALMMKPRSIIARLQVGGRHSPHGEGESSMERRPPPGVPTGIRARGASGFRAARIYGRVRRGSAAQRTPRPPDVRSPDPSDVRDRCRSRRTPSPPYARSIPSRPSASAAAARRSASPCTRRT
jgi:hypothetical protein